MEYTGRLDDGTVFDTSRREVAEEAGLTEVQQDREYEPLTAELGAEQIIVGLEEELIGMEAGEEATVEIPPEKAYGKATEDRIQEFDTDEFAEMLGEETPEEGMRVQTQQGAVGEISHAGPDVVRIDFNHQLAGETLEFEVEILDVN